MNSQIFLPVLPGESPVGDGYFGVAAELDQPLARYAAHPNGLTEVPRFAAQGHDAAGTAGAEQ